MRILIVDDLSSNRLILSAMLEEIGEIDEAVNGLEGLRAAEKSIAGNEPYDLICLDINMPVMDGLETLHRIRGAEIKSGSRRATIIIVTASSTPENMLKALENEACDDYMVKPVVKKTFLAILVKHGLIEHHRKRKLLTT